MVIDFSNRDLYNYAYIPLLVNWKRYLFLMWGSWSWKSTFEAQKEIIKTFEKGSRLLWVRKVFWTIKDSMFAELVGVIIAWDLEPYFEITKSPMMIRNKITGSDIIFRWMDDPEKVKSIRRVSRVWVEEATELNKWDFEQLDLRLRWQKNMQITCTFNPIDEEHWLNTEFWAKWITEDVELMHTTYKDNRWVGPEYDRVLERLKESSPNMYKIYALGLWWSGLEWVIFQHGEIQDVPKEAELLGFGMDFGYTNDPTAMTAIYRWNWKIILDEVIYRRWLINVWHKPEDRLNSISGLLEEYWIPKSKEIWADSSEPKSIDEIYKAGWNIKAVEKGKDSILFGINTMQQYELLVTARSGNIKKEFRNYTWAVDKNWKRLNVPIDSFNHAIDGIRYFFMMRLSKVFKKKIIRVL